MLATLTKLSKSLSSAITSLRGNINMEIPDVDFERGAMMIKMDAIAIGKLRASLESWTYTGTHFTCFTSSKIQILTLRSCVQCAKRWQKSKCANR
jgi:hypothetical protein